MTRDIEEINFKITNISYKDEKFYMLGELTIKDNKREMKHSCDISFLNKENILAFWNGYVKAESDLWYKNNNMEE